MSATYYELLAQASDKFEREVFPLLLENQLIRKNKGFIQHSFPKRLSRLKLQKESIEQKISLLHNHIDHGNNLDDFDKVVLSDLIFILAQAMLGYFEILKLYLQNCLDLNKITISEDGSRFDEMIEKLSEFQDPSGKLVFHYDGLRKFFNVDLRRALVHDSWWLNENSEFTFEESDGTLISFNIGELHGDLASVNAIVLAFTENYVKHFDDVNYENIKNSYPQLFR